MIEEEENEMNEYLKKKVATKYIGMGRWFDCVELFLFIYHGSFIVGMTMRYIHLAIIVLDQTRHYQMICVEVSYMTCNICKEGNFQVSKISLQTIRH